MFTAQQVITAARDRNAAFSVQQTPDAVALRALSEYHQLLTMKVLAINPSVVAAAVEIALPLETFDAGYPVPDHEYVHGGSVFEGENEYPLTLVSWETRFPPFPAWPAAFIHAGSLFLTGRDTSWVGYDRILLKYAGTPAPLTTLADTFALPAGSYPSFVSYLAAFMGARGAADGATIDKADLNARWTEAESTFLKGIGIRRRATVLQIRDVYA